MLKNSIVFLLSSMLLFSGVSCQSEPEAYSENAATLSVTKWLKLMDSENYRESWETASDTFKTQVAVDAWIKTALAARSPLGEVVSRKLISQTYETSLQGTPDGEYVVMEFRTEFTNRQTTNETITPMLDLDGKWRVSGYYIR